MDKKRRRIIPLFLGSPLRGGWLGRRCGGLGHTAGLGLADDLGLFDNSRGLEGVNEMDFVKMHA